MRAVVLSDLKVLAVAVCLLLSGVAFSQSTANNTHASSVSFTEAEIALLKVFGPWPVAVPADAGNELSGVQWAEQLGEQLFSDVDMSGSGDLACISCHKPALGFAENLPVAVGATAHVRNTQGLLNVGLQRWFGWDGGADSLWAASLRPALSEIEMAGSIEGIADKFRSKDYVADAFDKYEGAAKTSELDDEQLVVLLAKSMAAYMRTLTSPPTLFDQFRTALISGDSTNALKNYPQSAARGLKIFFGDANCHVCHFGPNFSNGEFHDTGRPFFTGVGQVDPGRHDGVKRVREDRYNLLGKFNGTINDAEQRKTRTVKIGQTNFGQWRTPGLRNLTTTSPYMHDGSLATLRDVVDAYADIDPQRLHAQGESILKPLDLDDAERDDLVRFLETLSEYP